MTLFLQYMDRCVRDSEKPWYSFLWLHQQFSRIGKPCRRCIRNGPMWPTLQLVFAWVYSDLQLTRRQTYQYPVYRSRVSLFLYGQEIPRPTTTFVSSSSVVDRNSQATQNDACWVALRMTPNVSAACSRMRRRGRFFDWWQHLSNRQIPLR